MRRIKIPQYVSAQKCRGAYARGGAYLLDTMVIHIYIYFNILLSYLNSGH